MNRGHRLLRPDPQRGLTAYDLDDADVKRAAISYSRRVIAVAEAAKLSRTALAFVSRSRPCTHWSPTHPPLVSRSGDLGSPASPYNRLTMPETALLFDLFGVIARHQSPKERTACSRRRP